MTMIRALTFLSLALALGACGALPPWKKTEVPPPSDLATEFAPPVAVTPLGAAGQTPQALDTTTAAEKSAALAAPPKGGERQLGRQVAALGSPADPGLWVQTSLVAARVQGRVEAPNGTSLAVELRPGTGGALMSLAAYQALGLPLTDLPEMTVFAP